MGLTRLVFLTTLTMVAFAGNSLLCRFALRETHLDAASFTSIRLLSGAIILGLLILVRQREHISSLIIRPAGNTLSALALFTYAATFSFGYIELSASTGALLLFATVQTTMIGYGLWAGERLRLWQWVGFVLAISGLVLLLFPGLSAPPWFEALLMIFAGVSWGIYSVRGKGSREPLKDTAGNFIRTVPFTLLLSLVMLSQYQWDNSGFLYALASGALASGLGYALWYSVLPSLTATVASTIQLSAIVIAAIGGVVLLGEPVTLRLLLASSTILGGIGLVIWCRN